ncbi:hypothetical protein CVT24_007291 [Panaeolus cyanescens]|uniref:Cytochrome b561 domain-containing protein n=1 Tax=Panaeolus cyanescens TaxID=181874 RepID=A0A409YPL8_9AGAR|nr:hypothetical protein CVT24_007291 [Panaeolus cyanescens]
MSTIHFPLTAVERQVITHALLCSVGFLVLLPVGVLIPRLTRTLNYQWFWAHWIFQLVIAGPVIFAGYAKGHQLTTHLGTGHFKDPHEKMGVTLLSLYIIQLLLGIFVHFAKFPRVFRGYRPPHSYIHAVLGLVILALAQWQIHYGLYTEWQLADGGLHKVTQKAKDAWRALLIVFWVLYAVGLTLLPRQFAQERQARKNNMADNIALDNTSKP